MKHVPESNGKVGMLGSSYEGFTVVMALVDPHPALKVAAPMSPMVDGWMGDDWFHYGAFRQPNFDYFTGQTSVRGIGRRHRARRPTTTTRRSGAPGRPATTRKAAGLDQLPFWRKIERASGLRRVLAGTGARQGDGRAAAHRADDVDSGAVGSGGHVGRDPAVSGGRAEGHGQRPQLPGDGAVAPQPGELRRRRRSARSSGTATPRSSSAATC